MMNKCHNLKERPKEISNETINPEMYDEADECLKISSYASTSAVRIYNLIRKVGCGELTADHALHQMIEDYHNLKAIAKKAFALANYLEKKGGTK